MSWTLHFVSHTHWDREWYESFDAFRFRLVRLIDHLIDILKKDPHYQTFLLDGQTIVLEDYLEIRPEKEAILCQLIQSGRIIIGPWYILPDEFLISGETHIRNLLWGKKVARRFGGDPMKVGYLPDSFGHIAQMPQILKKSGIPYATFWRGVPQAVNQSEFLWEAPDGSQVLALYVPFGYGTACNLPENKEKLVRRIEKMVEKLAPFATTKHLLLMNGSDHVEPDPRLPQKLKILQKALPENKVIHSNLPYLFQCIAEEVCNPAIYKGEWRANDLTYLLSGTLSTRVYLKQKHSSLSHRLEGQLEPLSALLFTLGHPCPPEITYMWKLLLQNSPHDSICGCSIDKVHEEMMLRYSKIETVMEKVERELSQAFADQLSSNTNKELLVIFNPHPYEINAYVECDLFLEKEKIQEVDFEISKLVVREAKKPEFFSSLKLVSTKEIIKPAILLKEYTELIEAPLHTLPEVFFAQRYRIAFVAKQLPPCGFRIYEVVPEKTSSSVPIYKDDLGLENEFYKLTAKPDGTLLLYDKESGKEFFLKIVFEDGADAGDEYDYSPPEIDEIISTRDSLPLIERVPGNQYFEGLRISYEMSIPCSLSQDRKTRSKERTTIPITVELKMIQGIKRTDCDIHLENSAKDHRLRVLFVTPLKEAASFAGSHFAVLERKEAFSETAPKKDGIILQTQENAFVVLSQGLQEYEVVKREEGLAVALTLLRAVGWLSRNDLLTRKGNAGWPLPTPGAQCLGKHTFHLAVCVSGNPFPKYPLAQEALVFNRPPVTFQVSGKNPQHFSEWSFFQIDNPHINLSALKKHEDKDELVLRLYNSTPEKQVCTLSFNSPIALWKELSLLEDEIKITPIETSNPNIEVVFGPYEIKTFGILLERW